MKSSYSRWNLLENKLTRTGEKGSWIEQLFFSLKYRYIDLEIPYYYYLRGEVFVNDLRDLKDSFEKDIPMFFGINHLIDLLYIDFLNQIKKGVNLEAISRYLINQKYQYLKIKPKQKRVMKQINTNLFTFENKEEELEIKEDKDKTAYVTLRIKTSEILRGEIFLHDLSEYLADEHIQIEEVLVILFLDFIEKIKKHENVFDVMKSIVARF